jgi:hypothetical protein
MKQKHHVSTSIDRLLTFTNKKLETMFDISGEDVRIELLQRQSNGERLIGSEGCIGFDPVNGCPGHNVEE